MPRKKKKLQNLNRSRTSSESSSSRCSSRSSIHNEEEVENTAVTKNDDKKKKEEEKKTRSVLMRPPRIRQSVRKPSVIEKTVTSVSKRTNEEPLSNTSTIKNTRTLSSNAISACIKNKYIVKKVNSDEVNKHIDETISFVVNNHIEQEIITDKLSIHFVNDSNKENLTSARADQNVMNVDTKIDETTDSVNNDNSNDTTSVNSNVVPVCKRKKNIKKKVNSDIVNTHIDECINYVVSDYTEHQNVEVEIPKYSDNKCKKKENCKVNTRNVSSVKRQKNEDMTTDANKKKRKVQNDKREGEKVDNQNGNDIICFVVNDEITLQNVGDEVSEPNVTECNEAENAYFKINLTDEEKISEKERKTNGMKKDAQCAKRKFNDCNKVSEKEIKKTKTIESSEQTSTELTDKMVIEIEEEQKMLQRVLVCKGKINKKAKVIEYPRTLNEEENVERVTNESSENISHADLVSNDASKMTSGHIEISTSESDDEKIVTKNNITLNFETDDDDLPSNIDITIPMHGELHEGTIIDLVTQHVDCEVLNPQVVAGLRSTEFINGFDDGTLRVNEDNHFSYFHVLNVVYQDLVAAAAANTIEDHPAIVNIVQNVIKKKENPKKKALGKRKKKENNQSSDGSTSSDSQHDASNQNKGKKILKKKSTLSKADNEAINNLLLQRQGLTTSQKEQFDIALATENSLKDITRSNASKIAASNNTVDTVAKRLNNVNNGAGSSTVDIIQNMQPAETSDIEEEEVTDEEITSFSSDDFSYDEIDHQIIDNVSSTIDMVIRTYANMTDEEQVVLPQVTDVEYEQLVNDVNQINDSNSVTEVIESVVQRFVNLADEEVVEVPVVEEIENERVRILRRWFRAYPLAAEITNARVHRDVEPVYLGTMTQTCVSCDALLFETDKQTANGYTTCCQRGKVVFDESQEYPAFIRYLYTTQDAVGRHFRKHINSYNSAFSMISYPGSQAIVDLGPGQHIFKIQGHTYHRIYPADPPEPNQRKANQIYFLDPNEALNWRQNFSYVNDVLMHEINEVMQEVNPHVRLFHTMREVMRQQERQAREENRDIMGMRLVIVHDKERNHNIHRGRLNDPTSIFETAVVFEGDEPPDNVLLEIRPRGGGVQTIYGNNVLVLPFTFPMLYVLGELGHDRTMRHQGPNATAVRNTVTFCEGYAYRVHIRPHFSSLFHAERLFQKLIVCMYTIIEADRLQFIRNNQRELFIETLNGLVDYVMNRAERNGLQPGRIVVLPASFHGSPRHMHKLFLDAMACVRSFGKPDLFITMTTNPQWEEIVENLLPGQKPEDRPELVARVFEKKLKILQDLIMKDKIFGDVASFIYNIEYQKRGLPHAHILIILKRGSKIETVEDIDRFISAVIPLLDNDAALRNLVMKHMLHSPCGNRYPAAKCMSKGKCTKFYPQEYRDETIVSDDRGRPGYKRPNDGTQVTKGAHLFDNRRVVPYNPYLLKKLNCHINVEACPTYRCIKYIFKYIFKGYDCLTIAVIPAGGVLHYDEIHQHINCRYVSPCEAIWSLFQFKSHYNNHCVILLHVHLPNEQNLSFRPEEEEAAIEGAALRQSTLMAMFALNTGPHAGTSRAFLYHELPQYFTWSVPQRQWNPRVYAISGTIGRLVEVPLQRTELFYLRMLLLHVRGPTSFEDLRTVNGVQHATNKEACVALQLLRDDQCHVQCLQEASTTRMPSALRRLFAHLIVHCDVTNSTVLFDQFEGELQSDFVARGMTIAEARLSALHDIARIVKKISGRILHNENDHQELFPHEEPNLEVNNPVELPPEDEVLERVASLNIEQRAIYDTIIAAIDAEEGTLLKNQPHLFFLNGVGGSGKTYLYSTIIMSLKRRQLPHVCIAFTGIASLLLDGGTTAHYSLGLPLNLNDQSSSSIKRTDRKAALLREAHLILWDEAPMAHKQALIILDQLLRFIMSNELPFGGKLVLLGGDFRQILPVVTKVSQAQVAMASICNCNLWPLFTRLYLHVNERAAGVEQLQFAQYLQSIGNGTHERVQGRHESIMKVPQNMVVQREELVNSVFGDDLRGNCHSRSILCPTNAGAHAINEQILNILEGEKVTIFSADEAEEMQEDDVYFPLETMNGMTPPGLPPHELHLKVGAPVMCLRNLDLEAGLCNGTRMIVEKIDRNVLTCSIINGRNGGDPIFITKMELRASEESSPVPFKRYQFPVRLCYSMTINKSQGQTFDKIGVYLDQSVFSHGQLYVACSRVRRQDDIKICVINDSEQGTFGDDTYTCNIVNRSIIEKTQEH